MVRLLVTWWLLLHFLFVNPPIWKMLLGIIIIIAKYCFCYYLLLQYIFFMSVFCLREFSINLLCIFFVFFNIIFLRRLFSAPYFALSRTFFELYWNLLFLTKLWFYYFYACVFYNLWPQPYVWIEGDGRRVEERGGEDGRNNL